MMRFKVPGPLGVPLITVVAAAAMAACGGGDSTSTPVPSGAHTCSDIYTSTHGYLAAYTHCHARSNAGHAGAPNLYCEPRGRRVY